MSELGGNQSGLCGSAEGASQCPLRRSLRRRPRLWAWLAAAVVGLGVFAVGIASDLSLGDESHHFRKAALFLDAGTRLTHDPVYGPVVPPGIPYYDGALWHGGLALLWWILGTRSVVVAQAYQAAWVVLLIGMAWEAGRTLGGDRAAWWSLLAATLPCALFFGVLLYVEVAMMALLMLAAVLAVRRHVFWSGIAFGLAFLVKPTVIMVGPAWGLGVLLLAARGWRGRIVHGLLAGLGAALVVLPDLGWRHVHLGTVGVVFLSRSGGDPSVPEAVRAMLLEKGPETFYEPSSLWNPVDVGMFLGAILVLGLVLSLLRIRRLGRATRALWLLASVFLAVRFSLLLSSTISDVRYVMPVFAVLILIAGLSLADVFAARKGWAAVLVALAVVQALTVGAFALHKRRVSPAFLEAIREVRRLEVRRPPGFVLCPEPVVTTYGEKPILWSAVNPGPFFFNWSPEKQRRLLDHFGVEYIAVPRARVYDDARVRHTGGFPKSYVDRLPGLPYVDPAPVIDRGGLVVYRVRPEVPSPPGPGA